MTTALCALAVLTGWLLLRGRLHAAGVAVLITGYVVGGYRQARDGLLTLIRDRELDVDLLMVVAAIGAAAIGEWFDGALLIFIFALSGALEGYASARTTRDITALMALTPEEAILLRDGAEQVVPASDLKVDDRIVIRPGARIPADGAVVEGTSAVNQAPITGESVPVEKSFGSDVFAGSINGHGALYVNVTRTPGDTLLARIISLVREAQANRPRAQLFIERFERGYAKVVVLGAIFLGSIPAAVGWWTGREAIYRAMIFLVVASPCALAAAMMPTLLSALSNAARNGILFKGSAFIEALGKIDAIAFDKTGTLTSGHPVVAEVVSTSDTPPEVLLAHAASIESASEHPIGRAIVAEAARRRLTIVAVTDFQAVVGSGARARLSGAEWSVGRPTLFSMADDVNRSVALLESQGHTVVMVGSGTCLGYIALRDKVRPEAGAAIAFLRHLGIKPIVGLSGDSRATADAVAAAVGVDEMHAGLYPQDKVRKVKELASSHGAVAMVGDGVNDAPALAVAHVGIAMGGIGTDVALETADVVLSRDDVSMVPYAVALGRRSLRIIRQNLAIALTVIVALVLSDLFGLITLPWGVVGHEGSTLLVTLNGLRLLRRLPRPVVT
ncbi:MAG TPA: heavy metal translocating P-type ATPase [Acidothermaceae bacterium]